jgi:predicted small lipoprotein YifL
MFTAGKRFAAGFQSGIAASLFISLFISLAGCGLAAGPVSVPPSRADAPSAPRECEAQAQKFVEEKLQLWQQRMNLKSWNIKVNLVRTNKLKPKTLGGIHWDSSIMEATVEVLSTYDYKLLHQEMLDDMEFTVVHELVHLQLSSLPRSEASRRAEEHAVNEIAATLIKLAKP